MAESCVFLPKKGRKEFSELKKRFGHAKAAQIFNAVTSKQFIEDYQSSLKLTEEGVPTLNSILQNELVRHFLGDDAIVNAENKKQPHLADTLDNVKLLMTEAKKFNADNSNYVAIVDYDKEGNITIKVLPKTEETVKQAAIQQNLQRLNELIAETLTSAGVTIGQISKVERAVGRIGITNFNHAKAIGNEFVNLIRIANDLEGYGALSEEFSHLLVAIYKNDPLVSRALDYMMNEKHAREALGEEYDKVLEYQNGDISLVAEEAVGQALRDAFQRTIDKQEVKQPLFKRIVNKILSFFKGLNPATLQNNIYSVDKDLSEFAQQFLQGDKKLTKEQIEKTYENKVLNALSEKAEAQVKALKEVTKNMSKVSALRDNLLELREGEDTSQKAKAWKVFDKINNIVKERVSEEETMAAVAEVLDVVTSEIRKLSKEIQNIDTLGIRDKFTVLMNCLYTAQSFGTSISELKSVLTESYLGDEHIAGQKFMIDDIENTLSEFENVIHKSVDTEGKSSAEIAKMIAEESTKLKLTKDGTAYENTETGDRSKRVTEVIQATDDATSFNKDSGWKTPSTNIGTGLDELVRDTIAGRITEKDGKYEVEGTPLSEVYPNASEEQLQKFVRQILDFKKDLEDKGITLIPRDVTVCGNIETVDGAGRVHKVSVAGTLDLLGYDKDGNWHIYDMKTHHRDSIKRETKVKYAKQLSLYKQFLEDTYGIKVADLTIIPIKVDYPTPKGESSKEGKGTAEYEVSKTKHSKYNGAESNQLLINGEEFKDANPNLGKTFTLDEVDVPINYGKLSGDATNGLGDGGKAITDALSAVDALYTNFMDRFSEVSMKEFIEFLKPFVGETIEVRNKDGKMVPTSIRSILERSDSDISTMQYWFNSMADNPDALLQIFDKVYKRQKTEARLNTIEIMQKIVALGKEFEDRGLSNYDFLYEGDKKHYVRHTIIDGVDYSYDSYAYEKAKKDYIKSLNDKYGEHLEIGSKAYKDKNKDLKTWIKKNSTIIEEESGYRRMIPSPTKYPSKYNSFNATQKEFYDRWMEIKSELDSMLDAKATTLEDTIKIRRSLIERSKDALVNGDFAAFGEGIKSNFVRSYDDDIVYTKGIKGFNGEEIMKLPTYYINNNPNKDWSDLSTDAISTLCAYAEMCCNYNAMRECLNPLEIGRQLVYHGVNNGKGRIIEAKKGGKTLKEAWYLNNQRTESNLTVDIKESKLKEMLDNFFNTKIFQQYLKDAGEMGGVDVNKAASFMLKLGSMCQLGFNGLAQLANVGTGIAMINIEAASGEFFNVRELAHADKEYTSALKDFFGDIGQRAKNSKLALVIDTFNIRQNFTAKRIDFKNKTLVGRIFGPGVQFLGQEMGDHWLYSRVAIAMMLRQKMLDKTTGKEITLWEALETVPVDSKHPNNGHKLKIRDGVVNLDGSTFDRTSISNMQNKITYVNQHLFGIYNDEDMVKARNIIWLRFVMQYRDWIPSQFRYRFGSKTTNLMKGGTVEGYYRTTGRFMKQIFREFKEGNVKLSQTWKSLEPDDRKRIRRAIAEVSQLLFVSAICVFLGKSKDKDRSWAKKLLSYWATRERTELSVLVPSPFMITEGMKIIKSPVANTSIWSDISNLTRLLWPPNYTDEIENGDYKGHSTAYRAFVRSPLTLWYRTINRTLDPEKAEQYYNTDR